MKNRQTPLWCLALFALIGLVAVGGTAEATTTDVQKAQQLDQATQVRGAPDETANCDVATLGNQLARAQIAVGQTVAEQQNTEADFDGSIPANLTTVNDYGGTLNQTAATTFCEVQVTAGFDQAESNVYELGKMITATATEVTNFVTGARPSFDERFETKMA